MISFIQRLEDLTAEAPLAPAITCAGDSMSRAELLKAGYNLAVYLHNQGVREDDMVTVAVPNSIDFFFDGARLAVAVFLCIGGFLTGLKLSEPNFFAKHSVQQVIWHKYLRLVIPYLGAIALAIAASFTASRLMEHHSISAMPDVPQLLSHLFFYKTSLVMNLYLQAFGMLRLIFSYLPFALCWFSW